MSLVALFLVLFSLGGFMSAQSTAATFDLFDERRKDTSLYGRDRFIRMMARIDRPEPKQSTRLPEDAIENATLLFDACD